MNPHFIIADPQWLIQLGLKSYLKTAFDINEESFITVVTHKKALITILLQHPDSIVCLDFSLFDITSIDSLLVLSLRFPKTHWLLLSDHFSQEFIIRIAPEKTFSLIYKHSPLSEWKAAIQSSLTSQSYHSPEITEWLQQRDKINHLCSPLTPTEEDILRSLAEGLAPKQIAAQRNSSIYTIKTHKKNIFRKLDVNNTYEAIKYALRAGIIKTL